MNVQLKVNVEELKSNAVEINTITLKIGAAYDSLKQIAEASTGHWEGEAANKFRRYVNSIDNDMSVVLNRLKEYLNILLKMAEIYNETEEESMELTNTLPKDIIT